MRMKPWPLSLTLLLLAILLLAAVPAYREPLLKVLHPVPPQEPKQADYEAVALANPTDPDIWLGYAAFAEEAESMRAVLSEGHLSGAAAATLLQTYGPAAKTTARVAHAKAAALQPDSPVYRLRHGICLLSASGDLTLAGASAPARRRSSSRPRPVGAAADRREAEQALLAARALAPGNAACDYFLAAVYFASRRELEALAAARSGAAKQSWSTYERELALGRWRLVDRLPAPLQARPALSGSALSGTVCLRYVGRSLLASADRYRQRGNHAEAIACQQCVVRLGYLMRTGAYSLMDGLLARAVTDLAAPVSLVPAADWAAARRISDREARVKRERQLRETATLGYLRAHGRADLAAAYVAETAAADAWDRASKDFSRRMMDTVMDRYFSGGVAIAAAVIAQAALLLLVAFLVGLAALLSRQWRHRGAGPEPTYPSWLVLLACALAPPLPVAAALTVSGLPLRVRTMAGLYVLAGACVLGVIAWLAGVGVLAGRHRAGLAAEQRPGRGRAYLAVLCSLMTPTLMAFALLGTVSLPLLTGAEAHARAAERRIASEGEVKHYGIGRVQESGESAPAPGASLPSRPGHAPVLADRVGRRPVPHRGVEALAGRLQRVPLVGRQGPQASRCRARNA